MTETMQLSTVDYISQLQANAPPDVLTLDLSMAYEEQRKYVCVKIPPDIGPTIELIMLTDVQWGAMACVKSRYKEYLNWILAVPNRFVFFGGDMINSGTLLSKATPFEDEGHPLGQIYQFCEVTMPIRHRVLGYVGGNHERHTRPTLGRSAGSLIASVLRIPYSDGQQYIDIYYGPWKPFKVTLWHGSGSAQTAGAKMQKLVRFMSEGDSHLYLMGHLHDCMVKPHWRVQRDVKGRKIGLQKYYGCMSSSFMEFWGTYAEAMGLTPTDTVMARCVLEANGHWEVTVR